MQHVNNRGDYVCAKTGGISATLFFMISLDVNLNFSKRKAEIKKKKQKKIKKSIQKLSSHTHEDNVG